MSATGKSDVNFPTYFILFIISLAISIRSTPKVGEIHTARIGMKSLFGAESKFDSAPDNLSESSSTSSSASSRKFDDHARPRPCVIWKTTPFIHVLVMARFSNADVADPNVQLFDNLTHEYVLKRLVPVSPKIPYNGRRSISARTTAVCEPLKIVDTNLILIPAAVPDKWKCKIVKEYFPVEELRYVNRIISEIQSEETEEQEKSLVANDYLRSPKNDNINNQDDNSSSSASSSIPKTRRELVDDMHCKTNDYVNQWLDHGQSK
jgi:hypothetical protein